MDAASGGGFIGGKLVETYSVFVGVVTKHNRAALAWFSLLFRSRGRFFVLGGVFHKDRNGDLNMGN